MASSGWHRVNDFSKIGDAWQEKEDRESVASFVKVGRLLLLLFKDRMELILSEI